MIGPGSDKKTQRIPGYEKCLNCDKVELMNLILDQTIKAYLEDYLFTKCFQQPTMNPPPLCFTLCCRRYLAIIEPERKKVFCCNLVVNGMVNWSLGYGMIILLGPKW